MRCGENGFVRRDGQPCGFNVPGGESACHHHRADKTREREILEEARLGLRQKKLPAGVLIDEWDTAADVRLTLSRIAKAALTQSGTNLKVLDVAIRACSAATSAFQVESLKELNETILRAEGHGPALVILEGLKAGKTRRLADATGQKRTAPPVEDADHV